MDFWNQSKQVTLCFLTSTLLFSMASPVLKLLIEQGKHLGFSHPDAISFCNVLFVGNLCAGLITFISFPKRKIVRELKDLSKKSWGLLMASSFVAVLYPSFIFVALENTTVPRVILISRFEGIFYAIIAFLFLKQKLNLGSIVSYIIIGLGVAITIFSDGMLPDKADILLLSAAVFYGVSELLSTLLLDKLSMPSFIFFRNFTSAIIFFIIAVYLYGIEHFADMFYGDLWISMFFYAIIIIVIGQLVWFKAIKKGSLAQATNYALIIPFFALFFSWLLLNETPSKIEWIAVALIGVGMIVEKIVSRIVKPKLQVLGAESGLIGR